MTGAFSFLAKIVYMKSRQLRDDVNWVLNCPDLLQGDGPHLQLGNDALLNLGPLRTTPWKVGRYFEALVAELLINSKTHILCDSSRQIQLAGQTIGELDFIYLDLDEELTHCETAIKYYLYYPNLNWTGSHFIGPNPHDTFESKTTRLLTHQLPLSQRYYPKVSKRETFVKGIIFYPADHRRPVTIPAYLAQNHQRGVWLHAREVHRLELFETDRFCICHKPHWLAPPADEAAYQDPSDLVNSVAKHFRDKHHPLMISRLRHLKGSWTEQGRLFIVPNYWPNPRPE